MRARQRPGGRGQAIGDIPPERVGGFEVQPPPPRRRSGPTKAAPVARNRMGRQPWRRARDGSEVAGAPAVKRRRNSQSRNHAIDSKQATTGDPGSFDASPRKTQDRRDKDRGGRACGPRAQPPAADDKRIGPASLTIGRPRGRTEQGKNVVTTAVGGRQGFARNAGFEATDESEKGNGPPSPRQARSSRAWCTQ